VFLFGHFLETATRTLLIWIGVCSLIGSLSVMASKGIGLALSNTIGGIRNEFTSWLTWVCIVALVLTVSVQMNFLNKVRNIIVASYHAVIFSKFSRMRF